MEKTKQLKHPTKFKRSASNSELKENRDYSTLSETLFQKGEFRLLHGDKGGIEYFEMAAKLD